MNHTRQQVGVVLPLPAIYNVNKANTLRELLSPIRHTVRCAYHDTCPYACQEGSCKRPVHFYAAPVIFTLQWIGGRIATDEEIALEHGRDEPFETALEKAISALANGDLETAESATELAVELFAEIQNRAFQNRRLNEVPHG